MKAAPSKPSNQPEKNSPPPAASVLVQRHLRFGWWALLIFLTMGLALESLHGFKVGLYLKVSNETRRLMWTLAHAHGTLLGLVNLAFASTIRLVPAWPASRRSLASSALLAATILMPAGFFLGGVFIYAGDPGLGILLVPIGGILLFGAVFAAARAVRHFTGEAEAGRGMDVRKK